MPSISYRSLLNILLLLAPLWTLPTANAATTTLKCRRPCQNINTDPIPAGSVLDLSWQFADHYLPEHFDIVLAWGTRTNALTTLISYLEYSPPKHDIGGDSFSTELTLPSKLPSGDYYWIMMTPYDAANYTDYTTNFGPYHIYGSDKAMNASHGPSYPFDLDVRCSSNSQKCGQNGSTIEMGGPLLVSWSYAGTFRMALYWGSPDILGETATAVVQLFPSLNCTKDHKYGVSVSTQSILNLVPPGPYYYLAVESTGSDNLRSFAGPFTIKSSAPTGGGTSDASSIIRWKQQWLPVATLLLLLFYLQ